MNFITGWFKQLLDAIVPDSGETAWDEYRRARMQQADLADDE